MFPIDFVRRTARFAPDAIAASDGKTEWTYKTLLEECDAIAHALQDISGVERPRVAVCGNNTLGHFATVLAVHAAGGILIPINARNSAADVQAQIERAAPDIIYTEPKTAGLFRGFEGNIIGGAPEVGTFFIDEIRAQHAGKRPTWPDVSLDDINGLKFTGGTSGVPKAVEQSFRCVNTLITIMMLEFRFGPEDRHLCVAPISHGAGTFMIPILATGGMNRLVPNPDPATVLKLLDTGEGTTTFIPPTLIYSIMDAAEGRRPEFRHLRHLIYGAAPMPPEKVREARDFFRGKLEVVYGQTEMPVVMSIMTADCLTDDALLGSAGRITPCNQIEVMSPDGKILPPGETGEIVGRGPLAMTRYYEMPDETERTIVDGWLHTGDLGYIDDRGFLFIKDRLRDVIITGGFNVYPIEVEDALFQFPAIREAVVFGVADEKWGERVEAAVELHPGQKASENEIIAFVKAAIGSVKAPKHVHISENLPRSSIGKVLRKDAKAWAIQQGTSL